MIEVTYYREENRLTLTGHAESGEFGHDLVCAAASILALTLSANVTRLCQQGLAAEPVTRLSPGSAQIRCRANAGYEAPVREVFLSLWVGFRLLAEKFPAFVSCRAPGWE